MLNSEMLLKAMTGIDDEYILKTDIMLEYRSPKIKKHHLIGRTVLIAAVIATLLTVAAVAASFWGRKDRTEKLPPDNAGHEQQVIIPNGFKDSPTYIGSLEWWTYLNSCKTSGADYSYDFVQSSDELYSTAILYMADSEEKLDKLIEIADKYDLKLYKSSTTFRTKEDFEALTGVGLFTELECNNFSGYIFDDGSFKLNFEIIMDKSYSCSLTRIYSGSIYPYGGVNLAQPATEGEYETQNKQAVSIGLSGNAGSISYVSPDGKAFIELNLTALNFGNDNPIECMKLLADKIDFDTLCHKNKSEISFAARNQNAADELKAFEESPVFKAAYEFNEFFSENFRDPCFTGVHGTKGFDDIDSELEKLSDKYALNYAEAVHKGNELYPQAVCYDNGAWYAEIFEPEAITLKLHYIPKDALYTGLSNFVPINDYAQIWIFNSSGDTPVILASEGSDKISQPFAFYDTGNAFVILYMNVSAPAEMEKATDSIDWTLFK